MLPVRGEHQLDRLLSLPRYAFTRSNVDYAPEDRGVYALFDAGLSIVYIGFAGFEGIRSRLASHFAGAPDERSTATLWYTWELALLPEAREAELLAAFVERHKRRPRCQDAG